MKRLLWLVIFLAVFAGYFTFAYPRLVFPAHVIVAFIAALFVSLALMAIPSTLSSRREGKLVQQAMQGACVLQDGKLAAVAGQIYPVDAPLMTPFQDSECVAYEYQQQGAFNRAAYASDLFGFAVTPCLIRSSAGDVRLLGYPLLGNFQEELPLSDPPALAARYESIAAIEFSDMTGFFGEMTRANGDLENGRNPVRRDWKRAGSVVQGPLQERYLRAGEKVCVVGTYSASQGGLIPKYPLQLAAKRGQRLIAARQDEVSTQIGCAASPVPVLILLIFLNLLFFGGVTLFHRYAPHDTTDLVIAVENKDTKAIPEMIQRGYDPNGRDVFGDTVFSVVDDPTVAKILIENGANVNLVAESRSGATPLMMAAQHGKVEVARVLLEHGARVNEKTPAPCERTALSSAVSSRSEDVEKLLLDHGAEDERVSGFNGTTLPEDGGEPFATVRKYVLAVQATNQAQVKQLRIACGDDFSQSQLEQWRDRLPIDPEFRSGWINDNAATLHIVGVNRKGKNYRWDYHLKRFNGRWMILREW